MDKEKELIEKIKNEINFDLIKSLDWKLISNINIYKQFIANLNNRFCIVFDFGSLEFPLSDNGKNKFKNIIIDDCWTLYIMEKKDIERLIIETNNNVCEWFMEMQSETGIEDEKYEITSETMIYDIDEGKKNNIEKGQLIYNTILKSIEQRRLNDLKDIYKNFKSINNAIKEIK